MRQLLLLLVPWTLYFLFSYFPLRPPLSEEQFEKIVEQLELDDAEEISGSDDSDTEDEEEEGVSLKGDPRVFLVASEDRVVAVHRFAR